MNLARVGNLLVIALILCGMVVHLYMACCMLRAGACIARRAAQGAGEFSTQNPADRELVRWVKKLAFAAAVFFALMGLVLLVAWVLPG